MHFYEQAGASALLCLADNTVLLFPQRNTLLVTHADHRTQSYRKTPGSISYSVKLVILDALLPVLKLVSRLSQASEHSSVPKLTNLLITIDFFQNVWWRFGWTGYHQSGRTIELKTR